MQPDTRAPRLRLVAPGQLDHHVADMTATMAGDLTLVAIQRRLADQGQWLPMDGDPDAAVARLVEGNSTGPLRLGYGAWRDLLLGCQFTNGQGELITAGGRTVKNVAGYDLTKFIVGQGGVFGRVETITARTYRLPAGALFARMAPDVRLMHGLVPTDCRPHWALLTRHALLLGFLGDEAALDYYGSEVRRHAPQHVERRTMWEDVEHRAALWCCEGEDAWRAAVPPARLDEFAAALPAVSWAADAAFGVVLLSGLSRGEATTVRDAARRLGGSAWANRISDGAPLKGAAADPVERKVLEHLKSAFDPQHRLAPLPWTVP